MLFVSLFNLKPTAKLAETTAQRLQWKYPEGLKVIAEYWLQADKPHVICIAEADDIAPMIAAVTPWFDHFEVTVIPAVTAEEGMKLASQMMPQG